MGMSANPSATAAPVNFTTGQNPSIYGQAANAYTNALQGTQAAMAGVGGVPQVQAYNFTPMMAGSQGYNPAMGNSVGYTGANAGSQGYNAAMGNSVGYTGANAGSQGYNAAMGNAVGYNGANTSSQGYDAATLAGTNLQPYMNPYTSQVINSSVRQLGDAQRNTMNTLGASATAAKAFGGSRHGVAEGVTNAEFGKQTADMISGLNQANFTNAQGMAQYDTGAQNAARSFGAGAANNAMLANQASANTASQFGAAAQNNMFAANQAAANAASQFGAGASNNASLANQASANAASQFGAAAQNDVFAANQASANAAGQFGASSANNASLANQASANAAAQYGANAQNNVFAANQAAANAAGQFGAGAANNASLANQSATNAAGSQYASAQGQASQANQSAYMAGLQQLMSSAGQMGNLSQQGFNMGQSVGNQQSAQGGLQQGLQQMLIDAAKGQYAGWAGAPQASLGLPMAAVGGGAQLGQSTTTNKSNPGLFDYLSSFAGILGGLGGR